MSPSIYSVLKDKDNIFVVIVQTLLENEEEKRQRKYDTIVGKETIKEDIFMQKFTYCVPTEIIFGKDTERECGKMVKRHGGKKVLIVYGGGSVRHSGLLERVEHSLEEEGISYVECGGVTPNPRLSFAEMGVKKGIEEGVDFILAVGGRSTIDAAKAIAHGTANPGVSLWDIWTKKESLTKTLKVGAVLTISAAGSETSDSAVLTNEATGKKLGLGTELNRPVFAIMNPELTYTLPKYQIGCGIADIMMHTLERYFIPDQKNRMTDEIAEGLLRTVIDSGRMAMKRSDDYDAMSELMWCGSLSHNNLTGLGREKDFSVHKLGHALSARFDCAHGATLASVWGAWAWYVWERDIARFAHYAKQVWGIERDEISAAKEGIERTIAYFEEIGMPTSISGLGIGVLEDETLKELALDATMNDTVRLSLIRPLSAEDVLEIFRKANY